MRILDDAEMDAQLSRTLVAIAADAADIGEALATARRVPGGDYDSWYTEWSNTANTASAVGDDAARRGHKVTARKAYLRASEYWRQAFFFIRHDIADERLQRAWRAHRLAFRAAIPYLDWATITTEIPFDGVSMTGYLFRATNDGSLRPTVVAPCGYDSTAEAGYCATGYMALARGYNFFVFEGPGQGGMLYEHRRRMRPDYEVPFAAAFEWLLTQEGVDPGSVAVVGRSFGGYLGPRAAAFEPRIAALVADPGQYDFVSRMGSLFGKSGFAALGDQLQAVLDADPTVDAQLQGLLDGPRNIEWFGSRMATLGAGIVGDFIRRQVTFNLDGVVDRIRCPTLITEGEGDFASQGQVFYDHLQVGVDKQLKKFSEEEGAGGHCEGLGATLFEGYAFDWLDDVLGRKCDHE
jgi:pimeloyl-ACP methyl ester carboxylesterase